MIAMTAHATDEDRQRCERAGTVEVVLKRCRSERSKRYCAGMAGGGWTGDVHALASVAHDGRRS
ncbi:hypothetical protein [Burkholderia cepacia]|uniref:hypothetical protein n=1 Tax=Burkholderia cepacia TaxID=292 RepID=UPI00298FF722|nr:hypothetical protein [Burkholderia cepacia]